MNKNYVNNAFYGEINNKKGTDYYNDALKIRCGNTEETLEKIHKILGTEFIDGEEFYDEFWTKVMLQNDEDEYIGGVKLILNKDDSLYSETNIAKTLELMGTSIIRSEKKKDNPEQYIRVFHSKEMFLKALNEQESIRAILNSTSQGKYAIDKGVEDVFILSNQTNYKKEKKITELDDKHLKILNDTYGSKYPQVNDYYIGYINMKKQLNEYRQIKETRKLTKEENYKCSILNKNIKSLKNDFIECINNKVRPIVFKTPLPDGGNPSWDEFDFFDKTHVRALLQVPKNDMDLQDDLSCIVRDLNNYIKECNFTDIQRTVLDLWRKDKTQEDIGNTLGVNKSVINGHISAIVTKIIAKHEEHFINYYYLNLVKGVYKTCKKCNEVKLIHEFSKNGTRYRPTCKKCNRKS